MNAATSRAEHQAADGRIRLMIRPPEWRRGSWRSSGRGRTLTGTSSRSSRRTLLTNIMLYWVTQSGASSRAHLLREPASEAPQGVQVPTACAVSQEISIAPGGAGSRRNTTSPMDGNAARRALCGDEEPNLLADDIRAFFRTAPTVVLIVYGVEPSTCVVSRGRPHRQESGHVPLRLASPVSSRS